MGTISLSTRVVEPREGLCLRRMIGSRAGPEQIMTRNAVGKAGSGKARTGAGTGEEGSLRT